MNLRRNFLAASISLLCVSQSAWAADIVSTVTLNGIARTMTFKNQEDANKMITEPTPAQTGLFANVDADGNTTTPATANGLISQSTLNNTPLNLVMVKSSGADAQAVVGQPKADGTTEYVTLKKGNNASLTSTVTAYANVVNGTATAEQTAALDGAVYRGVDATAVTALKTAVTEVNKATVKEAVDVAVGGTPKRLTDAASVVNAQIQYQINVQALAGAAAVTATETDTPVTATELATLDTITQSTLVQLKTATTTQTATSAALVAITNDTTLDTTVKATATVLAKVEVVNAIQATATAASARANDTTATLDDKVAAASQASALTTELTAAVTAVKNDANATDLQKTTVLVSQMNALAEVVKTSQGVAADPNATLAQIQTATENLKTVAAQTKTLVDEIAHSPNATEEQIKAATKVNKDAAQAEVTAQTAIVNKTTDPTEKAKEQAKLDEANKTLTEATKTDTVAQTNTDLAVVNLAISKLNDATATDASKDNALKSLKSKVTASQQAGATANVKAAVAAIDATLKATLDTAIANDAIVAKLNAGTITTSDQGLKDIVKNARAVVADANATAADKAAARLLIAALTPVQLAAIEKVLPPVDTKVTDAIAVLKGTGDKEKAVKTLKQAYNKAKKDQTSSDAATKASAVATLDAISGEIATYELNKATAKFDSATKQLVNTDTAKQIFDARKNLGSAKASAAESLNYKSLATPVAAAGITAKLTTAETTAAANTLLAQAKTQLANTSTAEYYAQNTAANGIAGNPSSMMGLSVDHMFSQGADVGNITSIANGISAGGMQHSIGAGIQYNYFNLAGTNVNTVTLPLSYSVKLNSKGQVIFSVPLSYIGQDKNDTYQIGAGVAFKYNATENWTLTPAFNFSHRAADSTEVGYGKFEKRRALGDGVSMLGGGLTSKYTWKVDDMQIALTNMGSYFAVADGFSSTPADAVGFSNDLGNFVMKNGISIGKSMGGFALTTYFNDVEYYGSKLYFDQYDEFGFSLRPENMGALNSLSIGANYLFSFNEGRKGDLDGFKVNLNYQF